MLAAYPWINRTGNATHTVEPIGQIIARTGRAGDQTLLPNEDARSLVFDDTNLFELDKNSGFDRIETGTRANVGLQYTFQLNSGGYARLLAGQSFHLSGQNVYAKAVGNEPTTDVSSDRVALGTTNSGLGTDRSDYVLGAYVAPDTNFRVVGQGRFDQDNLSLRRADVYALASYGPFSGQAVYSYTAADSSVDDASGQQDIIGTLSIQLSENWSLGGAIRYDIDAEEIRQDSLSLRYADECFVITATYADSYISDPENGIDRDRSILLRFELKHLGDFRYRTNVLDTNDIENQ